MRYVKNWYSLLLVYFGLVQRTMALFKDGEKIYVSKSRFLPFYEGLYSRHLKDNGFKFENIGGSTVVRTPNGLTLCPNVEEPISFVLDEIFISQDYGDSDLIKGRFVIDVGAAIGDSSLYFASMGAIKVYGFEPDASRFDLAIKNIKLNNLENKVEIAKAFATKDSIEKIIIPADLTNIFLKIDCDGCEYELINTIDNKIAERVDYIVMEYHGSSDVLVSRLKQMHFVIVSLKRNPPIITARKEQLHSR